MSGFAALGFIGLGVMGEGMCANLVRKRGEPAYGFDADPAKVARLAADGLTPCASVEDLARQAEVIFLSLPGGPQVEDVTQRLLAAGGKLRCIVDMSTAPAGLTRALAARCADQGVAFVDAPVARTRQAARDGTLSIMVGGTAEEFAALLPYLRCMGTDVTHCGAVGAGQVAKILNNMVVLMNVHALAEALALGKAHGVDPQTLFDVFALGSADSFMLHAAGMKALVPDAYPTDAFPTEYALKDIGYALDLAKESGLTLPGASATTALLEASHAAGHIKEYYPVFIKVIEGRAGEGA